MNFQSLKKLYSLAAVLMLAIALVACGGDDDVEQIDTSETVEAEVEEGVVEVDEELDEAEAEVEEELVTDTDVITDADADADAEIVSQDADIVTDTVVATGTEVLTETEIETETTAVTEEEVTTTVTTTELFTDTDTDTESTVTTDSTVMTDSADLGTESADAEVEGDVDVVAETPEEVIVTDTVVATDVVVVTDTDVVTDEVMVEGGTIVDVAIADGNFETLVLAVTEAGLAETLSGDEEYTVFAPTDDAFESLPAGTLDTLLEDPEGDLQALLLNHVVEGAVLAGDLEDGMEIETVGGSTLTITIDGDVVMVNGAEVTTADIETDNGVIHVIDTVITE